MRKASGRSRGANKRAGRIGLVVVCGWWEQDFERRLEAESLVWGKEERTTPAGGEAHRQRRLGFVGARKPVDVNDLISLTVEAKRKRCGGEIHLVVPPNSSVSVGHPKPSLIKAIARAHGWYEKVVQGNAFDMRSLAR